VGESNTNHITGLDERVLYILLGVQDPNVTPVTVTAAPPPTVADNVTPAVMPAVTVAVQAMFLFNTRIEPRGSGPVEAGEVPATMFCLSTRGL
jgi:hypothetical protein